MAAQRHTRTSESAAVDTSCKLPHGRQSAHRLVTAPVCPCAGARDRARVCAARAGLLSRYTSTIRQATSGLCSRGEPLNRNSVQTCMSNDVLQSSTRSRACKCLPKVGTTTVPSGMQQRSNARLQSQACASTPKWCSLHHRTRALAPQHQPQHLLKGGALVQVTHTKQGWWNKKGCKRPLPASGSHRTQLTRALCPCSVASTVAVCREQICQRTRRCQH